MYLRHFCAHIGPFLQREALTRPWLSILAGTDLGAACTSTCLFFCLLNSQDAPPQKKKTPKSMRLGPGLFPVIVTWSTAPDYVCSGDGNNMRRKPMFE